ncbi:MAG TPA: glycosyltransferase family 2 protein [Flavobacterium sp.]|jgi:GT2 family glycosyltransferase
MKKIIIIIITYNGLKWIEECLNSLLNSSIIISIIVIDNNSTDETVSLIKKKFPHILILEQKQNLGFGKANNIGLKYALDQKADYVFLLNQDAFVEKDTIKNLINISNLHPEYGILSPVQLDYSGKNLEDLFFKFMSKDSSKSFYSDAVLKNKLKPVYEISFVQAAAWLLPINTIKKIGGFDPLFYHYGEDNNFCQRVVFHKMKIGVVPTAYIRHDSHKPKLKKSKLFSHHYFAEYKKEIAVKFGDINVDFGIISKSIEKKKIYKLILYNLLTFKFTRGIGFLKQLIFFKKAVKQIEISRYINKQLNSNYLDE